MSQYVKLQNISATKLHTLQSTHREKLGFQQATDYQQLRTLDAQGRIQNTTLQNKNAINLDYQNRSGNLKLGQQAQGKRIEFDYQNRSGNMKLGQQMQSKRIDLEYQHRSGNMKLGQQAQGNMLDRQKIGTRLQGAAMTQQIQSEGNRWRHEDNLQYKRVGG